MPHFSAFFVCPSGAEVREGYARAINLHISVALHQRPKGKSNQQLLLLRECTSSCCWRFDGIVPSPVVELLLLGFERLSVLLLLLAGVLLSPRCRYSTEAPGVASHDVYNGQTIAARLRCFPSEDVDHQNCRPRTTPCSPQERRFYWRNSLRSKSSTSAPLLSFSF